MFFFFSWFLKPTVSDSIAHFCLNEKRVIIGHKKNIYCTMWSVIICKLDSSNWRPWWFLVLRLANLKLQIQKLGQITLKIFLVLLLKIVFIIWNTYLISIYIYLHTLLPKSSLSSPDFLLPLCAMNSWNGNQPCYIYSKWLIDELHKPYVHCISSETITWSTLQDVSSVTDLYY